MEVLLNMLDLSGIPTNGIPTGLNAMSIGNCACACDCSACDCACDCNACPCSFGESTG